MSTQNDHPEDEFDRAGRDRTPQGVHRAPRSIWRTLGPIIAIVVLAPLLAWGAVTLLGDRAQEDPPATATSTESPAGTETPTETAESTEGEGAAAPETSEEPSAEASAAAPVDFGAGIAVLNGAGVNGLAGDVVGQLADAGFTGGTAADYGSAEPQATTLYYNNADLAATAEAVGETIGITNLVESASATSTTDIAIVLRADYVG